MSRVQLALNVDNLEQAVEFYSTLFGVQPAKRKPGYANFAVTEPPLKLVLIENPGQGGSVNHLGVEVESSGKVHAEIARLSEAGLFTEEQIATTCCFATQDKVWVTGPNKERWEVYTVLADTEHFGTEPQFADKEDAEAVQACCGTGGSDSISKTEAESTVACCAPAAAR
ncbi:glyoxalase/bleomycin resistance/dioxygenase family protein [Nocardia cyriacigeorgica]|uniref:Glyoxalase/bleomycin resistance/dioxygenase family protein n=1 Tax=Nocardia cyriacigeorgica TaxID=135487 RepID=A0A6P1CN52_9NOCA|nr:MULTISPECIES: ArsI/CadI family heavy metal resistance metalloenzyme [Nocardia]MBF6499428.1 VOC family protein [Nocardia cyriacigeorgica]NEW33352.1 glyoxalase/bleomycin resistance/dioxygenase family protein [Nocardia cyriacigeorgica]